MEPSFVPKGIVVHSLVELFGAFIPFSYCSLDVRDRTDTDYFLIRYLEILNAKAADDIGEHEAVKAKWENEDEALFKDWV